MFSVFEYFVHVLMYDVVVEIVLFDEPMQN